MKFFNLVVVVFVVLSTRMETNGTLQCSLTAKSSVSNANARMEYINASVQSVKIYLNANWLSPKVQNVVPFVLMNKANKQHKLEAESIPVEKREDPFSNLSDL